ncbi:Protein bark beetle, partial [Schistosoma japonicum]
MNLYGNYMRCYALLLILSQQFLRVTFGLTYINSSITGIQRWKLEESPFIIKHNDLIINSDAMLIIDPGVSVLVGAGLSIKVKGTIYAKGTPDHRIVFTKLNLSNENETMKIQFMNTLIDQPYQRIRLVNGKSLNQGELQLWLDNKWRSVCSQNKEWSKIDSRITCQQLGYFDGNFSYGSQSFNRSFGVEIIKPNCSGNETSEFGLFSCPGLKKKHIIYGRNICNTQDLVNLNCWGVNTNWFIGYWKGIEIFNATHKEINIPEEWGGSYGNTRLNVSASVLEYVDIQFAGVNRSNYHSAALSSSPYPPILNNICLTYNAYHAINFHRIRGPAILQNVTIKMNHGHGVKITSLMGYIRMKNIISIKNVGDGLNLKLLSGSDYHWPEETFELIHRAYWVCRSGSIPASPVFPFLMIAELPGPTFKMNGICEFHVASDQINQVITISLLETIHDPLVTGRIEIWDTFTMSLIANWSLNNQTFLYNNNNINHPSSILNKHLSPLKGLVYQGVSSIRNAILIKFTWKKSTDRFICTTFTNCIRALLHVSVGRAKSAEVIIQNSIISQNNHHGLYLINPWTYIVLENNTFEQNQHEAGVKILGGSADILINDNKFIKNQNSGLNISVSGGFKQINNSIFHNNYGHGLIIWNINQSQFSLLRHSDHPLKTYVHLCNFTENYHDAIRFYDSCLTMEIIVNFTYFSKNHHNAIRVYTCYCMDMKILTNFTLAFSHFYANQGNAVKISPMVRIIGKIVNSTFEQHLHGVIWIDNMNDDNEDDDNDDDGQLRLQHLRESHVAYVISHNEFRNNHGSYVIHLRLTETSKLQHLTVIYNKFLNNHIQSKSSLLKPRSTCPGVIVIGSSNVHIIRNHLWNPYSDIELASHLSSPDKQINATLNYWGNLHDWSMHDWTSVHKVVFNKIFDQNHRYTLAKINYHPLLKDTNLRSNFITSNEPPYLPDFIHTTQINKPIYLGGRLPIEQNREVILKPIENLESFYYVTKDIFIPPMGRLIIQSGVKLYFDSGVGLFSQGELKLEGTSTSPIIFDLHPQVIINTDEIQEPSRNHSNPLESISTTNVRLTGGEWSANNNTYYGRLEVWISRTDHTTSLVYKNWSAVCENGFNEHAAMLACHNMGLVAHPKSWLPPVNIREATIEKANKLLKSRQFLLSHISYINCHGYETDLSECELDYEPVEQTLHQTCMNLVIKCHRPGWSGIRITASDSGSRTIISHVHIHHAGLLDYARLEYIPSLQLDYFSGTITKLKITSSLSDGLVILNSNPLMGVKIIDSQFIDNFNSGLLTSTPWFMLINCQITGSQMNAGLQYNRMMTIQQRYAFHAGMVSTLTLFNDAEENSNRNIPTTRSSLPEGWSLVETYEKLSPNGIIFANIPIGKSLEKTIYRTELSVNDAYHLHQIIVNLHEFPGGVKLPTSQQQAQNFPKACIGPSITLNNSILPAVCNYTNRSNRFQCSNTTSEELIIYDSGFANFNPIQVYNWRIPKDLIHFPLISSTNKLIIELRVDGIKSGQFAFSIQVKNVLNYKNSKMTSYNNVKSNEYFIGTIVTNSEKFTNDYTNLDYSLKPKFLVENTLLEDNLIGVKLYHYNDPTDKESNHFWRNEYETFIFHNVKIRKNRYIGMNIQSVTQFTNDLSQPDYEEFRQSVEHLSFINYNITNCEFSYNNYGSLISEHNPVEFANNIWSYQIIDNKFFENGLVNSESSAMYPSSSVLSSSPKFKSSEYGIQFSLPFISHEMNWRQVSGVKHQIHLLRNQFNLNKNFHLQISGYTAKVNIEKNQFLENYCQFTSTENQISTGLIHSFGMEREIFLLDNYILQNKNCQYIIQLNSGSQSLETVTSQSYMQRNILQDNDICMNIEKRFKFMNPWECYSMGVFGTQNITIRHNSFDNCKSISGNSHPCYELIAGIQSVQILNVLDAQQNYWGTSNVDEISNRIFDFNQWNSLSLINFDNYLISYHPITNNIPLKLATSIRTNATNIEMILKGRIENDLFIPGRSQPYRIMSDITVMPGVELHIEPGVTLEFAPHTGLLVLGTIKARGTQDNPIFFTSLNSSLHGNNQFSSIIKSDFKSTRFKKPNIVNDNKSTLKTPLSAGRITLSTENIRLIGGEEANEGFVQFFNYSTKKWYIACDNQFSKRVAQVICSEFNVPTMNAIIRFSNLYDHYVYGFENSLNIKHIWMESYACNGFESKRAYCLKRFNYDAFRCLEHKNFVFLRCISQDNTTKSADKTRDLSFSTWGNIRIVQLNSKYPPDGMIHNHVSSSKKQSILEYVNIINAGLLHGERVPALTSVNAYPKLSFINIENCLGSGFEFITPNGPIKVTNSTISNCLEYGLGLTILNSDSTDPITIGTEDSKSFYNNPSVLPFEQYSLFPIPQPSSGQLLFHIKSTELSRRPLNKYPYNNEVNLLGFISMCSIEKVINILDRSLVYFKYSSRLNSIHSCTKVFRSIIPGRRLAWRFLAVNLYHDPLIKNFIQLNNGVNYSTNDQMIAFITPDIVMNENHPNNKQHSYITSPIHDELTVYMHASSTSDDKYGFIAEIISLPLSVGRKQQEIDRFIKHEIDTCEFYHNQEGGLRITSIGEFGPDIHLANLRLKGNGLSVLNLTGPPAVKLYLTNSRNLVLRNSYFVKHTGDVIRLVLLANQLTNGIQANLTNNVIVRNQLGSILQAHGNHFNAIQVLRNYIAHNDCGHRPMIHINGILSQPFANNFIYDNRADILLKCEGNENLNQYSTYQNNGFYNNQAINLTKRSTIFSANSKNIFRYNYFRNVLNDYELVTGNQSIISVLPIQSGSQCPDSPYTSCPQGWRLRLEYDACICYRPDKIDAQYNWWGDTSSSSSPTSNNHSLAMNSMKSMKVITDESYNQMTTQNFAQNRIYDHNDDSYLIEVNYANTYISNQSILGQGIYCPPNWDFHEYNCFYYFGAPMTYQEANDFCLSEVDGILATSQDRIDWLSKMLKEWQHNYDWINRYAWVTRAWVDSDSRYLTHCSIIRNGWLESYSCHKKIGFFCQK